MPANEKYIKCLFSIVQKAGVIARKYVDKSQPRLKPDSSVLSKADKAISKLIQNELKPFLKDPSHILIDEEDPKRLDYLNQEKLNNVKFVWSVDPIDGTRSYVNKIPCYGVSIGLLKDLKPWIGIVYFPALNELFYCDGSASYFIKDAFTPKAVKKQIRRIDQKISSQSVFLAHDAMFRDFKWDYKDCHVMIQSCAVIDFCWPAIGRACGSMVRSSIWDFAGGWPIAISAGLKLRHFQSGRELSRLELKHFDLIRSPWKLKEYYVLSTARNFKVLKRKLKEIR